MPSLFLGRNRVTSGFRLPVRPDHGGVDIVGDDDTTIHAVAAGKVKYARMVAKGAAGWGETWQWGYFVWVDGDDGRKYIYAHMAKQPMVAEGARVAIGHAIGIMGNTGYSFGAHTHFEVRSVAGVAVDPTPFCGVQNAIGSYASTIGVAPEVPVPAAPPSSTGLCYVQVGAFKVYANADAYKDRLQEARYKAFIKQVDGYYKVQLGAFGSQQNAVIFAADVQRAGYPAVVMKGAG